MKKKFFNTAGPCKRDWHYFVERKTNCADLIRLIEAGKYFVHHAPRQSGKSTTLIDLCHKINAEEKYTCLYINVEAAQVTRHNVAECNSIIVQEICNQQRILLPADENYQQNNGSIPSDGYMLQKYLSSWSENNKKPIVLIIDEIDSLIGDGLISVLRQLRAGYANRPKHFPYAMILNGVRDLRDYRIYSKAEDTWLTGGSCFNIKSDSVRMSDFNLEQVKELFEQHTAEHGQRFADNLVEEIYELTCGQPWLCNALGDMLCFRLFPEKAVLNKDELSKTKEELILKRDTHIDQLYAKLDEERVRNIVMPMLAGETIIQPNPDDIQYCIDLGLLSNSRYPTIANPIYREILPRELSSPAQQFLPIKESDFYHNDRLLMDVLMQKFVAFYRENAQEKMFYHEITPHILLMAFLQRIINGGGQIIREYALGRRRLDLGIIFGADKFAIEIKVKEQEKTWGEENGREKSLIQLSKYMDSLGINENGYLVVFSRDFTEGWEGRFRDEKIEFKGKKIHVFDL